jgi:phosphatidylglycerophosphate synthase
MKSARDLALKGEHVEEWIDVRVFRPAGMRLARALLPTRVSADQVTLSGLVVGVVAGHLFVYADPRLDVAGLALVVAAEVLDSADGQLARLRGASSRWGRILDGYVDNLRWVSVYAHLVIRFVNGGAFAGVAPAHVLILVMVAGFSHSLQAAAVDFVQGAYLGVAGQSVLDLPEDLDHTVLSRRWWNGISRHYYRDYVKRQATLFPRTVALLRRCRGLADPGPLRAAYLARQRRFLPACGLLGQNAHLAVLGAGLLSGFPAAMIWADLTVWNLALAVIVILHEKSSAALLRDPAFAGDTRAP